MTTLGSDQRHSRQSVSNPPKALASIGDNESLLSPGRYVTEDPSPIDVEAYFRDLNLDQIIGAVVADREEREFLTRQLSTRLHDPDVIRYRHEVFADLREGELLADAKTFSGHLLRVRSQLDQVQKMHYPYQRAGWFLDAVATYCDAVISFGAQLEVADVRSRGLRAFREYLLSYVRSDAFISLIAATSAHQSALQSVRYTIRIRGLRVDVRRYLDEADYSDEVLKVFDRFEQGAVKDYRIDYRSWPGMDHVGAQILERVARLFPVEFGALARYVEDNGQFFDERIRHFDRELQFYVAYLEYIESLESSGLKFCFPDVTAESKEVLATATFDLALAKKLAAEGHPLVCNDFYLEGSERILVISGPNQGGKTTFARTFGQLHHLAATGCPIPGTAGRVFLCDKIFTHFEREEDLDNMNGKLENDLIRIHRILNEVTGSSVVIMNEVFGSTTLKDARFLGTKILERIIELDLLCVYVTFIDELASLSETIVSMVSMIVPDNPAERTYRLARGPANGLAYALAIAEKYRVTYSQLSERIAQ